LLDSGSVRSLISFKHFKSVASDSVETKLSQTDLSCVTASGQSLEIMGEVKLNLKIHGFTWKRTFLVSKKLRGPPILGADFMCTTNLVLDFGGSSAHFAFAPQKVIRLVKKKRGVGGKQLVVIRQRH